MVLLIGQIFVKCEADSDDGQSTSGHWFVINMVSKQTESNIERNKAQAAWTGGRGASLTLK